MDQSEKKSRIALSNCQSSLYNCVLPGKAVSYPPSPARRRRIVFCSETSGRIDADFGVSGTVNPLWDRRDNSQLVRTPTDDDLRGCVTFLSIDGRSP
jgi:hypothetical protein